MLDDPAVLARDFVAILTGLREDGWPLTDEDVGLLCALAFRLFTAGLTAGRTTPQVPREERPHG